MKMRVEWLREKIKKVRQPFLQPEHLTFRMAKMERYLYQLKSEKK
jgi:hypothetical protein